MSQGKATKSLRKENLLLLLYDIFCSLCVFVLYYILYSIYIHDDFFKRNVIGRDNKRHHNYNQKKICVFLPFSFHIYMIYIAELSSFRWLTKREMSQQHHEMKRNINWDAACDIDAAGYLLWLLLMISAVYNQNKLIRHFNVAI